ncbi:MAG: ATP-binding protein, partial [Nanoarchaeota archaeon]|nr:ATP-binding protein [Nanoarchaeota archaeon]
MEENVKVALEKQNPWWFNQEFYSGIDRLSYYSSILKYLKTPEILLLVGARRTGKSTLLYQVIKQMLEKESPESILFINLDEPLFQSKADNPAFLSSIIEEYQSQKKLYVFIDEIQNYDYWVQTIKAMYDTQKNIKFILTGSSSTLIQSAITTKLSGRYFYVKVSPLSFSEFLAFNLIKKPSTLEIRKNFDNYLKFGAFPRVVLEKDEKLKLEILKNYFQTIYLKDVIYSHNLRNNKEVFELLYFIISNVGSPFSYSHIAKILHISADTVKEYVQYAEESYLIRSITKFDYSLKKQMAN